MNLRQEIYTFTDESEAQAFGRSLAESLKAGDVIALCGTLGAGKTQVSKGLAQGLGSAAEVSSPTFGLVHEYRGGRLPIFHFDFYRLEAATEAIAFGWEEYLDAEGICVVEWADKFPELLPPHTQWWHLAHGEKNSRQAKRFQPTDSSHNLHE